MRKGYWIATVDVADPAGYQAYVAANKTVFEQYGGQFLVRNGESTTVEGSLRSRVVVIEFDSYSLALACYQSPEYQAVIPLRAPHSQADIVVIEGYLDA